MKKVFVEIVEMFRVAPWFSLEGVGHRDQSVK